MNNQNPNETRFELKEAIPAGHIEKVPIEFFDFLVIDECHRSIYNLWKQVLDYYDVFQIGLTATPDNRMFGYFNQNLVKKISFSKKTPSELKKTQKVSCNNVVTIITRVLLLP
ncbi:DEAD/DEAH box helicase family protein [Flavobacterium sp. SOK18b]|uniref:DEAD/DEAH box helicase family protein n=1 Tax=Flavobacterium sp. SOK18b TaxID=797900 RepID=UPI0021043F28|nr:DEAD/DEAH box helicase family protein [Flavobacterium sp. SOK18b]